LDPKNTLVVWHPGMLVRASACKTAVAWFEKFGFSCVVIPPLFHQENAPHPYSGHPPPKGLATVGLKEDTEALLQRLQRDFPNRKLVFVGWSKGGIVVRKAAERIIQTKSHAIAGIVLLAPAPQRGISIIHKRSVLKSFKSNLFWGILPRVWDCWRGCGTQTFEEFAYSMGNKLTPEQCKKFYEQITWESKKAANQIAFPWLPWKGNPAAIQEASIDVPMLFVSGDADPLVPQDIVLKEYKRHREALLRVGKNPQLITFLPAPGHGHWLIGDEPKGEEVLEQIIEWILKIP